MDRAREIIEQEVKKFLAKKLHFRDYEHVVERINQACQIFYGAGYIRGKQDDRLEPSSGRKAN